MEVVLITGPFCQAWRVVNRLAEVIPELARQLGQETGMQSPKFFPGVYSKLPPWLG